MVSFSPVGVSWIWFVFLFSFFPLIASGAPSSLGSVVLDGSGFAATVKVEDIASKIVEFFGSDNVLSVQFMPGRAIRVTFDNKSFAATIVRESSVTVDNVVCYVRGGGPRPEKVLVFRYPFEADSAPLRKELSKYGEVHDIRFRAWTHLDNVMDGARVVRMTRSGPIPRSLHVNDHLCKAWYRGMPISCDICEGSHKAQNCPFKGKCMRCRQEGHMQRDCPNAPNAWGTVGGGPGSGTVDPTPAEAHSVAASLVSTPPLLPQTSGTIVPSSEAVAVELCDEGFSPVSPSPQSQSILTGLVPPAPESSIGAFSSSASVLSDPDSIESFPTEIENNENCMDMDTQDSCSILSNDGNDNGQSAHVHNDNDNGDKMNIKQSIDHVKNSNLDPSNDTIDSCIQNDISTSNDEPSNSNSNSNSLATSNNEPSNNNSNSNSLATSNDVPSISLASSNKTSGSGSRVAKSTGAQVKSQVSGSSSPLPLCGLVLGFSPRKFVVDMFLMLRLLLPFLLFLVQFQVLSVELSSVFFLKSNVCPPSYLNGSFFGLSHG